jgi:hypothetical protein
VIHNLDAGRFRGMDGESVERLIMKYKKALEILDDTGGDA